MTKTDILKMLNDADTYVSGQDICDKLELSRTAVWKAIKQLKEEGYEIDAIKNKGYLIKSVPDRITDLEIKSLLADGDIVEDIIYFEETDSSNNQAKIMAEHGHKMPFLVIAEEQTAGKGRRGRKWISPKKSGIYMTLAIKPDIPPQKASMLTIVAAMAVANGLKKACFDGHEGICQIKWPNDIVINKKKAVGILTEMSAEPDMVNYVVVGIGINVNNNDFDESIREMATSISLESKAQVSRRDIIAGFIHEFSRLYKTFEESSDLSGLMDEYNKCLVNINNRVKILGDASQYEAQALGIDKYGRLLVKKDDGEVTAVLFGEVSVRGLYGYA